MTAANCFSCASVLLVLHLLPAVSIRHFSSREGGLPADQSKQNSQVTVPVRPSTPLFKGKQGKQASEIKFAPSSRTVTIKLRVEDPSGYFLPNIRRDDFAVYEDGVKQKIVTVEVEHAPVSVALLLELGGHYHTLNQTLALEDAQIGRGLLDEIGRADKVAIFTYDSKLHTLADFNESQPLLDGVLDRISVPGFSEANFYDALLATLNRMRPVSGRKAIIAVSSGVDTFSKASLQQVLEAARDAATPIYTIGLEQIMEEQAAIAGPEAPFAHIDWNAAEKRLEMLANVSGGRAYVLDSDIEIPAIYDDIMENLRLRYVITYVSSNPATTGPSRKIRVELVNPHTGGPLEIRDSNGKTIMAKVFVQGGYSPKTASAPNGEGAANRMRSRLDGSEGGNHETQWEEVAPIETGYYGDRALSGRPGDFIRRAPESAGLSMDGGTRNRARN